MQGADPGLELLNEVLLVAALVCFGDDFVGFQDSVVRDVEVVADLIKKGARHHARRRCSFARPPFGRLACTCRVGSRSRSPPPSGA